MRLLQLDKMGANPYQSCTRGYDGTRRYRPDGRPSSGQGRTEQGDEAPNLRAHCASPPSDGTQPNVRGAQNLTAPAYARSRAAAGPSLAAYDPSTGLVTDGDASALLLGLQGPPPPTGEAGLAWLLTSALRDAS